MSMSTHVIALRDMDGEFKRMIDAKKYCDEQHLSYPKEVEDYFKGEAGEKESYLYEEYLRVDIDAVVKPWHNEYGDQGYEIEVATLPAEVKTLRFYNSW